MKIYTKTGDAGETGLFAGQRVPKDDPRIEACGSLDELNAALGFARAVCPPPPIEELLARVQHELFALGAELATPDPARRGLAIIGDEHISTLEQAIDRFETDLPALDQFILPGGTLLSATLHTARSICRRAERRVVTLRRLPLSNVSDYAMCYLNRLGDLLFVMARTANAAANQPDVVWSKGGTRIGS